MRRKTGSKRNRNGLIAALDVGSTKVCCLIAATGDGEASAYFRNRAVDLITGAMLVWVSTST